jgi:hypothetical protein
MALICRGCYKPVEPDRVLMVACPYRGWSMVVCSADCAHKAITRAVPVLV